MMIHPDDQLRMIETRLQELRDVAAREALIPRTSRRIRLRQLGIHLRQVVANAEGRTRTFAQPEKVSCCP